MSERFQPNFQDKEALMLAGEAFRELRSEKMPKIWKQVLDRMSSRVDVFQVKREAANDIQFIPQNKEQKEKIVFQIGGGHPPEIAWYFVLPKGDGNYILGCINFSKNKPGELALTFHQEIHPAETVNKFSLDNLITDESLIRNTITLDIYKDGLAHFRHYIMTETQFEEISGGTMIPALGLKQFIIPN